MNYEKFNAILEEVEANDMEIDFNRYLTSYIKFAIKNGEEFDSPTIRHEALVYAAESARKYAKEKKEEQQARESSLL